MNKFKHILSFVFLLLIAQINVAQNSAVDSLRNDLKKDNLHDTTYLNLLTEIGERTRTFRISYWDTIVKASEAAILSQSLTTPQAPLVKQKLFRLLAGAIHNIGYIYNNKGDIPKALEHFRKSLKLRREVDDKIGIANSLNSIGRIYQYQGEISKALEYLHKSLKILEEQKDKKGISVLLNSIGIIYDDQGDALKALEYYHKSLEIRKELGDKRLISIALNNIGGIYNNQDNIPKALEYYHKALKIREELGDKRLMATSLNNIGFVYDLQGDVTNALKYYYQSLKIREEEGNKKDIVSSLNNIGYVYKSQGDITKALECYNKTLKLNNELGDQQGIAFSLNGLGSIAKIRAKKAQIKQSEKDSLLNLALEYYQQSLIIRENIGDKNGIATSLNNIATVYRFRAKQSKIAQSKRDSLLIKSLDNYNKSLTIFKEVGNKRSVAQLLTNIGQIMLDNGKTQKVQQYGQRSLALAKEMGTPEIIQDAAKLLSLVYEKQNKGMQALEMHKLYIVMRDSISNQTTQRATAQQQAKYEYEKQKAIDDVENDKKIAIEQEAKQKQQIITTATAAGSGLIIIFLFFAFNRLKVTQKQNKLIEHQRTIHHKLKALSAQMNPHFIFNSLNSIQYFITENDIGNSKLYLSKFAGLMRKTLENSEHTFISLSDEIHALKEYLELERLRMENKFEYNIEIDKNINIDDLNIPTLLLQPYVENAIWHGIAQKGNEGKIKITINETTNRLKCVIDDNGIGRMSTEGTRHKNHKSYAMNITKTRLDLINAIENDIINIDIIDKTDKDGKPTGTTVILYVPNDL